MSAREWQSGDVAMIDVGCPANRHRGIFLDGGWRYGDDRWSKDDPAIVTARPLLVIDPEDRDQATRLWQAFAAYRLAHENEEWDGIDAMQAALREFANPKPPKPDEPTGLGAVVEAICGCDEGPHRFIHDPLSPRFEGRRTWKSACGHHAWSQLRTIVRVLSEGYEAGEPA
jgi:hypothetical protein